MTDLVDTICNAPAKNRVTWYDRLTTEQRSICDDVKQRVKESLLPHSSVARRLIDELQLPVSVHTVRRFFNE